MKYNTRNKRNAVRREVVDYLTDCGYGLLTARYEVHNWVEGGLKSLSETPREDIRRALVEIGYNLTREAS